MVASLRYLCFLRDTSAANALSDQEIIFSVASNHNLLINDQGPPNATFPDTPTFSALSWLANRFHSCYEALRFIKNPAYN